MRLYLDQSATSWPKPEAVYAAVLEAMRTLGAPAGRGGYAEAREVERRIAEARRNVATVIGADDPQRIVFTQNATDSLNLVIHGWLRPGDHVVTSVVEHNSVLRPLAFQRTYHQVEVSYVGCSAIGVVDANEVIAALRDDTRLVVIAQASNVTGAIQPVAEVAAAARARGVAVLVDAAQSAGHIPIDAATLGVDFVAASGHKGLLGPLGTGVLYIASGREGELAPQRQGGTGSASDREEPPMEMPTRYEAGNLNVPGILGLGAGVRHLLATGVPQVAAHIASLRSRLVAGLAAIPGITLYGPGADHPATGVVSLNLDDVDPRELAAMLDSSHNIQARAGLHCAPRMHAALGTAAQGGTLRLSLGESQTAADVDRAIAAIGEIAAAFQA